MASAQLSRRAPAALLVLLLAGCTPAEEVRRVEKDRWQQVREVGAAALELVEPRLLTATGEGVAVLDYATGRVTVLGAGGEARWSAGDRVALANVVGMAGDAEGSVWLAEASRGRVYRLADGEAVDAVPAPADLAGVVPDAVGPRLILRGEGPLWARPLPDGRLESGEPPRSLRRLDAAERYPLAAAGALGAWAVALPFGGRYLVFQGDDLRCEGVLPGADGDEPEAGREPAVHAAALHGDTLYLLAGRGEAPDLLDRFDAASCEYLASDRLPAPGRAIAVDAAGLLHLLTAESEPSLLTLRRR
jgi:hypothetical protein